MDISKQYKNQCDCPEIQDKWYPKIGDWTNKGIVIDIHYYHSEGTHGVFTDQHKEGFKRSELIWLPRQDQLQRMVLSAPALNSPIILWDKIGKSIREIPNIEKFCGWEQLWLALVMHELHGKA